MTLPFPAGACVGGSRLQELPSDPLGSILARVSGSEARTNRALRDAWDQHLASLELTCDPSHPPENLLLMREWSGMDGDARTALRKALQDCILFKLPQLKRLALLPSGVRLHDYRYNRSLRTIHQGWRSWLTRLAEDAPAPLPPALAARLTSLSLAGQAIGPAQPQLCAALRRMPALTELDLSGAVPGGGDPFTHLHREMCAGLMSVLAAVVHPDGLRSLVLSDCQGLVVDVQVAGALGRLSGLRHLDLSAFCESPLPLADALGMLTGLTRLRLGEMCAPSMRFHPSYGPSLASAAEGKALAAAIGGLAGLRDLALGRDFFEHIAPALAGLAGSLTRLEIRSDCHGDAAAAVMATSCLLGLQHLMLPVSDMRGLEGLTQLTALHLLGGKLPLQRMPGLRALSLQSDNLALGAEHLTSLTSLCLGYLSQSAQDALSRSAQDALSRSAQDALASAVGLRKLEVRSLDCSHGKDFLTNLPPGLTQLQLRVIVAKDDIGFPARMLGLVAKCCRGLGVLQLDACSRGVPPGRHQRPAAESATAWSKALAELEALHSLRRVELLLPSDLVTGVNLVSLRDAAEELRAHLPCLTWVSVAGRRAGL